jgi:hypothetical protein
MKKQTTKRRIQPNVIAEYLAALQLFGRIFANRIQSIEQMSALVAGSKYRKAKQYAALNRVGEIFEAYRWLVPDLSASHDRYFNHTSRARKAGA